MESKTSPVPIKYHFLSETAISLSTISWSTVSSVVEGAPKTPEPSRERYRPTSWEQVPNNVKFADKPIFGYGDNVHLRDFPSSVSLEALRIFQNVNTGVTMEHIIHTMYHKEMPGTVCMEGERFDLNMAKDLLKRISITRRKILEKKIKTAELLNLPKVTGVSEDEEPYYNSKWEKYVHRPPRKFEYAYSYDVKEGSVQFIEKCLSPRPSPPHEGSLSLEKDPSAYFSLRRKPQARYVLKQDEMSSFNYLTPREIKTIQNLWIYAKKNLETFATLIILNCYKLKENESKKRVSLNKILQHRQLMSHGRLGMKFLNGLIQNLYNGSKSNQMAYSAGKKHDKWNFRPMLYELIVNGFLLTLIDFINPRITLEEVAAFRKFLTILFDIFKDGMNWNKHTYGRGKCYNTGYY